jgi:hypothetical protein
MKPMLQMGEYRRGGAHRLRINSADAVEHMLKYEEIASSSLESCLDSQFNLENSFQKSLSPQSLHL